MDAHTDLQTRMFPTATAVQHAMTLLNYEDDADVAVIPMYFPGKQRGVWETGQEVRTVPGVVFLAANDETENVPGVSWARDAASRMAKEVMFDKGWVEGTTAWAYVWRDGRVSVSEDFI